MTSTKYTASVISMRNNEGSGEWDLYLCDQLPSRETLADTIKQCFLPMCVMKGHFQQGAVPTLIEIRSPEGLVALANVELEPNPFRMNILWRETLSAEEASGLEKSRIFNQSKTTKTIYDITDAVAAEGGLITVKFLSVLLESQRFVEPIEATMKLIYEVERSMGKQANRVKRLEDELGL